MWFFAYILTQIAVFCNGKVILTKNIKNVKKMYIFGQKILHFENRCAKIYYELIYFWRASMKIELLHNKIIKDTASESFKESFENILVPKLSEIYGESLSEVQMYEDYVSCGFSLGGRFHYPLTVVVDGEPKRQWISWSVSNKKLFLDGVPYSYVGDAPLEFELCDAPEGFEEKISGRACYFEGGAANISVESVSPDKTFLSGKYSQTFVDEMARQISRAIEKEFSVSGIAESGVELRLVFAPGTYMEHVVENVTYRRLLISARACSARDLWIKWTHLNSSEPLTVSDNPSACEILFELGEDVPHKIREKEYRFLVATSAEKYQAAMGRKNVTEWRDLIKRVIKRGELIKCVAHAENEEEDAVAAFNLEEVLSDYVSPTAPELTAEEDKNSDITALLKNLLGRDEEEIAPENEAVAEELALDEPPFEMPSDESEPCEEIPEEPEEEHSEELEEADAAPDSAALEDEIRRKIEAEIRERLEAEARAKAEAEAERLAREREELIAENERLRKAEAERLAAEAERIAETEKLRLELEARELAEAKEKERMAQAARLALLEREKFEEEARQRREREEEERLAREAAEREAREAEERMREAEARRREEEARLQREREEEKARQPKVNYVSKNARLLFRRTVDPNVTQRIHEIILTTIKYFHKEDVYIKIKASMPDATTVNLNFEKIPESETELLINIIKVLGKSDLGITKVFLE